VKRSARVESIQVIIHISMEDMSFLLLHMSSLQQNWRRGQNRFCLEVRGGGREEGKWRAVGRNGPNNVCTYE
jgi:hypothetical protein